MNRMLNYISVKQQDFLPVKFILISLVRLFPKIIKKINRLYISCITEKRYTTKSGLGCYLYSMTTVPNHILKYKNSYLMIGEKIIYVNWQGVLEEIKIKNFDLFKRNLELANPRKLKKIHLTDNQINAIITSNGAHNPYYQNKNKYMIITMISYPHGGGESYLLETMKLATENNYQCIWISFRDKYNNFYKQDTVDSNNFGIFYKIAGGFNRFRIENILKLWNPNVIHTQGHDSDLICNIASRLGIPTILGYHFWDGLIKLKNNCNSDILKDKDKHTIDPRHLNLKNKAITQYVVSDFINDVITSLNHPKIDKVVYPTTDDSFFKIAEYNKNAIYITVLSINKLKGGDLVLKLIKELDFPFLVIGEKAPHSVLLDERIRIAVSKNEKSLYVKNQSNMKTIYSLSRMILIPTMVDETFCRVAYEAASNGIPLLTTGKGFIKYMLNIPELLVENNWKEKVTELYNNEERRLEISKTIKSQVSKFRKSNVGLMDLINELSNKSNNIKTW